MVKIKNKLMLLTLFVCPHLYGTSPEINHADYAYVLRNPEFSYNILDQTTNINRRQLVLLQARQKEKIASNRLYLHAGSIVLADFQQSNRDNEFGYLMRHPTSANQVGKQTSEVILFNSQVAVTGTIDDWFAAHAQLLYNPSQSFSAGNLTSVQRSLIQLREGYVVVGNLNFCPLYLAAGKMSTPFGLTDTVNPFTLSSVWHAFGGLAYGARVTGHKKGFDLSVMLIQGGAQFRAHNSGHPTPTRLENYSVDASYTYECKNTRVRFGASFQGASAYNQDYPVQHFNPGNFFQNPAWDIYMKAEVENLIIIAEFARTTRVWPGTHNPTPPLDVFKASHVEALDVGAKYQFNLKNKQSLSVSADFSLFKSGPHCSPWEKQTQFVLGLEYMYKHYLRFFSEYVHVEGFVPLNFISGGSIKNADGSIDNSKTWSNQEARSNIITAGIKCAF